VIHNGFSRNRHLAALTVSCALLTFAALSAVAVESPTIHLSSWNAVGNVEWRFDDDTAEAGPREAGPQAEGGFLVSEDTYADFQLTIEFWIEDDTNSGIFLRCIDPESINPDGCYEANIWNNHPNQDSRTGSIVKHVKPQAHVETIGMWNRYDIKVQGSSISLSVNDVVTATLEDDRLSRGHIALQYTGKNLLRFRNFVITRL
jgi:hypothetical protein